MKFSNCFSPLSRKVLSSASVAATPNAKRPANVFASPSPFQSRLDPNAFLSPAEDKKAEAKRVAMERLKAATEAAEQSELIFKQVASLVSEHKLLKTDRETLTKNIQEKETLLKEAKRELDAAKELAEQDASEALRKIQELVATTKALEGKSEVEKAEIIKQGTDKIQDVSRALKAELAQRERVIKRLAEEKETLEAQSIEKDIQILKIRKVQTTMEAALMKDSSNSQDSSPIAASGGGTGSLFDSYDSSEDLTSLSLSSSSSAPAQPPVSNSPPKANSEVKRDPVVAVPKPKDSDDDLFGPKQQWGDLVRKLSKFVKDNQGHERKSEIANFLEMNRSTVWRIQTRTLRQLRVALEAKGWDKEDVRDLLHDLNS